MIIGTTRPWTVRPQRLVELVILGRGQALCSSVTRTDTVPKSEFPTAAVYSDTKDAELRLITCGGTLDRGAHNYLGQTVVYATKV
jgi:hypothetical protein